MRAGRRSPSVPASGRGPAAAVLLAALALAPPGLGAQESAPPAGPTEVVELEAFVDGLMAAQLREKGVAGATVSVVRGDEVLLAKGYGWADAPERIPVDPSRTLFRIGSVTKLFTWTAIMQLEEEGLLELDADVNRYLGFEIPATFPEPVTVRDLLFHTPGFEEDSRGLFTDGPEGIVPMERWLADNIPARVRPPGLFSAYSNYGTALAGHIVERVSGLTWDEYVEERILEPLGMEWTTGRQPLPERLESYMSVGHERVAGGWKPRDWEIITGAAPAGSMSSTARDMARFMSAHLGEGALEGRRILEAETARRMHARHFVHDERLPGFGLGFYEKSSHGVRIIGHGGNTRWFHTDLAIFPELDLGVFVSYNTSTGGSLSYGGFLTPFLDHYFPQSYPSRSTSNEDPPSLEAYAGSYRANRASYTTFQKAFDLAGDISFRADDGVLIQSGFDGVKRFVPVGPGLFREEFGEARVAFRLDDSGRATHAFLAEAPMLALERVPWHGAQGLHFTILGGGLVLFVGLLVGGAVGWVRRRRHAGPEPESGLRLGWRAMRLGSLAYVVFAVAAVVLASDFWALLTGPLTGLYIALAFPILGLVATGVALWAVVKAWREGSASGWARARLGGAVAVAVLFSWSLYYWNLLGWHV